jgi:hypothetical protein
MSKAILTPAAMAQTYDSAVDMVRRIQKYQAEYRYSDQSADKLRACLNAFTMASLAELQLIEILPIVKIHCMRHQEETLSSLMNNYAAALNGRPQDISTTLLHKLSNLGFNDRDIADYAAQAGSILLEATWLLLRRAEESLSCVDAVEFPLAPLDWSNAYSRFKRGLTRLVFNM